MNKVHALRQASYEQTEPEQVYYPSPLHFITNVKSETSLDYSAIEGLFITKLKYINGDIQSF